MLKDIYEKEYYSKQKEWKKKGLRKKANIFNEKHTSINMALKSLRLNDFANHISSMIKKMNSKFDSFDYSIKGMLTIRCIFTENSKHVYFYKHVIDQTDKNTIADNLIPIKTYSGLRAEKFYTKVLNKVTSCDTLNEEYHIFALKNIQYKGKYRDHDALVILNESIGNGILLHSQIQLQEFEKFMKTCTTNCQK